VTCIFFVQEVQGLSYAQKSIYAVSFTACGSTINSTIRSAGENKQHSNVFYFCTVRCRNNFCRALRRPYV